MRSIVWCGPTFQPTGYADEVRGMALALHEVGTDITLVPPALESSANFRNALDPAIRRVLERCVERPVTPGFIQIQHGTIDSFSPANEHAAYSIGRSMFETDSLPSHWVVGANALDELWIPGEFNRLTFANAGIRTPMHVIPGGIDSKAFRPDVAPMPLAGVHGTVFLSVFEWRLRKGWDVLLRAWADAFTPDDDVTLVLRTYPISRSDGLDNVTVIGQYIDEYLRSHCGGRSRANVAPIVILGDPVPAPELPSLYTAAHAFVLPTRGEGWGRPFMESMACGVPVVATNWSAHLAFLNNDNGYLIDVDGTEMADFSEVPSYAGQRWASPRATHLTALLQRVHRDRAEARHLGLNARQHMVEEWPWSRVAEAISTRLSAIHAQLDDRYASHAPVVALARAVQVEGPAPDPCAPETSVPMWLAAADAEVGSVNVCLPVVWREKNRGPRPPYADFMFPYWQGSDTTVSETAVLVSVLDR
ncbi:MAG: glycosyltransferase family 4 protein, partial [Aureliella sp.]